MRRRSRRISDLCELFEGGEGSMEEHTAKTSVSEVGPGGRGVKVKKTICEGNRNSKGVENENSKFTFIDHSAQNVSSGGGNNGKLAREIRRRGQ